MGITNWRMVLLSTLAALVILVHSAEEDLEYHRHSSPRLADDKASTYEQTWRAIEVESSPLHLHQELWEEPANVEAPRRRRKYSRKQKLRPQTDLRDEKEERLPVADEEHAAQIDLDLSVNLESNSKQPQMNLSTKKKRKRPEMRENRWSEDFNDQDQPARRRGHRRKRPNPKYRPKMQEFNVFKPEDPPTLVDSDETPIANNERLFKDENSQIENVESPITNNYDQIEFEGKDKHDKYNSRDTQSKTEYSLEFPLENNNDQEEQEEAKKNKDKDDFISDTIEKTKNGGPIDPQTLKKILKKSNGASLSEILQQHNLTLADLLHGRGTVNKDLLNDEIEKPKKPLQWNSEMNEDEIKEDITTTLPTIQTTALNTYNNPNKSPEYTMDTKPIQEILDTNEDTPKIMHKRRQHPGGRRRLRLRTPLRNHTMKFLGFHESNILQKPNFESKLDITDVENMNEILEKKDDSENVTSEFIAATTENITSTTVELSTEQVTVEETTIYSTTESIADFDFKINNTETAEIESDKETSTFETILETTTSRTTTSTTSVRPVTKSKQLTNAELRRQALNNRLQRKRQKLKNATTEPPLDDLTKDLFGMNNLVSSAEFVAKTNSPKPTIAITEKHVEDVLNTLEDVLVTEASTNKGTRVTYPYTLTKTASSRAGAHINRNKPTTPIESTTEGIAKVEIEEILSDSMTGARLSKILKERNMTFDELALHRERGSSHVHLADIFHNASREPNPPEPFLSKSSIEPISKETYPLRALIEANHHDPALAKQILEPNASPTLQNIPIVMDYRNNVNENGENMGIVSLFNRLTNNEIHVEDPSLKRDSDGRHYVTSVTSVNLPNTTDNYREARGLSSDKNYLALNEIFSLLQDTYNNKTNEEPKLLTTANFPFSNPKINIDENEDLDGVVVLEDLQHLNNFDSDVASVSDDKLEMGVYESNESHGLNTGILEKTPSHTKSVTVATASIAGLTVVVFLLTYAAFKWRQQRNLLSKKNSFNEDHIPSPVFETRKGTKNNSSSRSISPMLPSSNIYTLSTMDSRNGKESPTYTWDSLRKPFQ